MLSSPFFNYSYGDLSYTYEAHMHPSTRMGLADAGAHVRVICDGGTPTFMLTHWTRDRTRGPKMPLEHVIHRQTRQTAELYGLTDRGLLAPGLRADVNVIDYDGSASASHGWPGTSRAEPRAWCRRRPATGTRSSPESKRSPTTSSPANSPADSCAARADRCMTTTSNRFSSNGWFRIRSDHLDDQQPPEL